MREGVERQQPGGMCIWSASAWLDVCPATRPPGEVSAWRGVRWFKPAVATGNTLGNVFRQAGRPLPQVAGLLQRTYEP